METFETLQPVTEPKTTNWSKIILAAVLGLALLAGAAYAGYYYGTQQVQQPEKPTPIVSQPTPTPEPTTPPVEDETKGWKTYTSTKYGYSLKYPKDWFLNFDSPTSQQFSDIESSSPFDTRMRVDVNPTPMESFREKYGAATGTKSEVAFKVIEEKVANLTVDGRSAVKLIRTPSEGATSPAYIVRILVAKDNDVFEISSWGKSKEDQQKYNDRFNQILSTFKFLD